VSDWQTEAHAKLATPLGRILGDKTVKPLGALGLRTVADLMHHLPRRYLSGTELSDLSTLSPGEEAAVLAEVVEWRVYNLPKPGEARRPFRGGPKARLEALVTDHRGTLSLAFFGAPQMISYWSNQLSKGSRGIFAGKVKEFNGRLQLAHPDFVILDDAGAVVGGADRNKVLAEISRKALVGLYPASGKIRTWTIAESAGLALDFLAGMVDPLPGSVREAAGVIELEPAFRAVHQPQSRDDVARGRARLRFDEAFALQLAMAARRADAAAHRAVPRPRKSAGLLDAFDARLPYTLTAGQVAVSAELMTGIAQPFPMQRLLQGEVGSGKTLVALRAMLAVVDAGGQAALLAPTEVLAAQHYRTITTLLEDLAEPGLLARSEHATGVVVITGSMPAAARRDATLRVASGEAGIVIGTHALFGAGVQFADLGLVVVDEQHRFGVEQRAALSARAASRPHVLVMTATPIPRSVAMTVFGDLEVSTLREIPAGRAVVDTVVIDVSRHPSWVDRAWGRIVEEVGAGRQAYVVCARISSRADDARGWSRTSQEEPDSLPGADDEERAPPLAAEDLYAELAAGPLASVRVDLLHGQLPGEEKDEVMSRFAAGETDVLVATTVVEVGVDVPAAAVMVVCDADRFGVSQLHQLRGRIGRGSHPGVCLLLTGAAEGTPARDRLSAVAATRDGFRLAEVDLEQRREGDVLGASQSGHRTSLRLLRVLDDADLIASARTLAEQCVADDPDLAHPGLADTVAQVELAAAGDWLERS
jgi:ATP-dependent DNA helicase RecG